MEILLFVLAAVVVALWRCDARTRRLPNRLTLPAGVGALGACVADLRVALATGAVVGVYLVGHLAGGVGAGDVKLALPVGAVGSSGSLVLAWGFVLLAFSLTVVLGRLRRERTVAHGPPMFVAAVLCGFAGWAWE